MCSLMYIYRGNSFYPIIKSGSQHKALMQMGLCCLIQTVSLSEPGITPFHNINIHPVGFLLLNSHNQICALERYRYHSIENGLEVEETAREEISAEAPATV